MEMFCPDTPSFCDYIWSGVELFSDDTGTLHCVRDVTLSSNLGGSITLLLE